MIMKTTLQLTITKESYILCRLFQCSIEEVLLYYMKQVNTEKFLSDKADDMTIQAMAFLAGCAKAD